MGVVGRLDQYSSMLASDFDDYSMSENLLTYSEQFNDASWAKNNYNVTANATTAPDGTLTADKLIAINASTFHDLYKSPGLGSNTYTLSIFAKVAEQSFIQLRIDDSVLSRVAMFNLATGSVSSSSNVTSPTIVSYPNGWYRCSITVTTNIINVVFNGFPTSSSANYSGDGVSGVFIWGAQFEYGSTATDYTPTTTTAISRVLASTTNTNITGLGTYYSSGFDENVRFTTFLSANVFAPYNPVYDEFSETSFGAGQGRYMRQNTNKSVIVYNEIDEITDFRDIVRSGLVLDLDAGMNSSFNNTGGTTWGDLTNTKSSIVAVNQQAYTTAGTYTFTVPAGCTSISAVVVGGGGGGAGCDGDQVRNETMNGGGGGGLAYGTITVTPGEILTITVGAGGAAGGSDGDGGAGGTSRIVRLGITLLLGGGGGGGIYRSGPTDISAGGASGGTARIGGGSGGTSGAGQSGSNSGATGGGGAGGYSGNGGNGGVYNAAGSASTGGGGGGGGGFSGKSDTLRAGGGGGVGIKGTGSNGSGGVTNGGGGGGGSALGSVTEGTSGGGNSSGLGGTYGGGGGGKADCFTLSGTATPDGGAGTNGAVRIVWGTDRSYPSTGLTDFTPVVGYDNVSHTAQLINAPTYSSANGGYLVFNGTNQYATSIFRTTSGQAVTYCGWLYSTETTATYRNFVDSVSANPMMWWNTTGQIEFDAGLYTTTAVYRNQWVYVALSKPSGNSSPSYYVNGVLVGTGSAYTTPAATPTWFNRAATQTWKGNASNVQAYNKALTAAEILQNYNALKHRFGL